MIVEGGAFFKRIRASGNRALAFGEGEEGITDLWKWPCQTGADPPQVPPLSSVPSVGYTIPCRSAGPRQASPQRARVISRFRIPWESNDLCLAHPVVCGGRLYIRHAHTLFAYDIRAAAKE